MGYFIEPTITQVTNPHDKLFEEVWKLSTSVINLLLTTSFPIDQWNCLALDRVKYLRVPSDSKGLVDSFEESLLIDSFEDNLLI